MLRLSLLVVFCVTSVFSAVPNDEVTILPGGTLLSKTYSGYMQGGKGII